MHSPALEVVEDDRRRRARSARAATSARTDAWKFVSLKPMSRGAELVPRAVHADPPSVQSIGGRLTWISALSVTPGRAWQRRPGPGRRGVRCPRLRFRVCGVCHDRALYSAQSGNRDPTEPGARLAERPSAARVRPPGSATPGLGHLGGSLVRALLSVANREGIVPFARDLLALGVEVIATDGTREALAAAGRRGPVRRRADRLRADRRRPGQDAPPGHLRRHPGPPRQARAAGRARRPEDRADRHRRRQRQPLRTAGRGPTRAHRRSHRDDRHRRCGTACRGRPQLRRSRGRGQPGPLRRRSSPRSEPAAPSPPSFASVSRPRRTVSSPPTTPRSPPTSPTSTATSSRDGWPSSSRRWTTCATARTRPSAPPSTARRPTAPEPWPTLPSSRVRGPPSTTCWTWTRPTPSPPTSPPRR